MSTPDEDPPAPGTGNQASPDSSDRPRRRSLPDQNWSAADRSRLNRQLGLVHSYAQPIVLEFDRALEAGDPIALTAMLPEPPNGDTEDQVFFYRLGSGQIVGFFNRCTHVTIPLDYDDGRFLDRDGYIMCRVHGARFELESGLRCAGPAATHLTRIDLEEDSAGGDPLRLRILGWHKVR